MFLLCKSPWVDADMVFTFSFLKYLNQRFNLVQFRRFAYFFKCVCLAPYARLNQMFLPDIRLNSLEDVSLELLEENQIEALMVDLDETLLPSKSMVVKETYRTWFHTMQEANIPMLILSNGTPKRVAYWSKELAVPGFSLVGKPFFGFKAGLATLNKPSVKTAMIGDQIFTDIWGANLAGLTSILVEPLSQGGLVHTRLLRTIEAQILKRQGVRHGRSFNR